MIFLIAHHLPPPLPFLLPLIISQLVDSQNNSKGISTSSRRCSCSTTSRPVKMAIGLLFLLLLLQLLLWLSFTMYKRTQHKDETSKVEFVPGRTMDDVNRTLIEVGVLEERSEYLYITTKHGQALLQQQQNRLSQLSVALQRLHSRLVSINELLFGRNINTNQALRVLHERLRNLSQEVQAAERNQQGLAHEFSSQLRLVTNMMEDLRTASLEQTSKHHSTALAGLSGPKGGKGEPGDFGLNGWTGSKGENGETGDSGRIGIPGTRGPVGKPGDIGLRGMIGREGLWLLLHHWLGRGYAADAVSLLPVHWYSVCRPQKDDWLSQPHLV
uniref:Scavenger receptor class A member 5 n=1 Tax=Eptatretus burgeri TaxID=7764 RepID=A0A8C4QXX5_EPTBU